MSRLAGRIRRLEARLGGCPGCAERAPLLGLSSPARPWLPPPGEDLGPCPDCGEPRELLILHLSFDPFPQESEDPPRGSLRWEQAQQGKRQAPRG